MEGLSLARLMKSWWAGDGMWHSVGVVSEGQRAALCKPCSCQAPRGEWKIFEGVEIPTETKDLIECFTRRLEEEFEKVLVPSSNEILDKEAEELTNLP